MAAVQMSTEEEVARVYASTNAEKSVRMEAAGLGLNLGELRKLVAAAAGMSDRASVKVAKLWGEGDSRYFKWMAIRDSQQLATRIVDVQVADS